MDEPRDLVQRLEEKPLLPKSDGELFSGYGVMSCPFASGDILWELGASPASSVGARPTPPSASRPRTATGTSIRMFRLGKRARAFSAERLQT